MYPKNGSLPVPLNTQQELDALDTIADAGDINEQPYNVFIGHNLGHRVFTMSVPFRKFFDISDVANDRDAGPIAQRQLDAAHAKKLAVYMLKGLVSAAKLKRSLLGKPAIAAFDDILRTMGEQPYFSLQPIVCNIRNTPIGGTGVGGIRGIRLETVSGETAAFKVFLSEKHTLWVIDGQHRRKGAEMTLAFLELVRSTGKYPSKGSALFPNKGEVAVDDEIIVWNEAYEAARSYATISVEVH
ncbi:MAG: DNA sulfur modification protein DndB, partial [Beijerinckiaceae bacterium]